LNNSFDTGVPPPSQTPRAEAGDSASVRQESVVRAAGIVSGAVGLSRITGLVRETVMAALFGASAANDAFLVGFRIPNLTRDLFAEGALSSAFVPVFTQYLTNKGKREAVQLSNLVATALIMIVGLICALGIYYSPELVALFAPGFTEVPGKYELAVSLTQIMFPFLLLVALAAQAMGILNANGQFGIPALSSTFFNIGSVGSGLLIGYIVGPYVGFTLIESMAYGVVIGGAMQLLVQVPSLLRSGFVFRLRIDFSHPGLRQILRLMGPAILGNAAVQVNVLVNTYFASGITNAEGQVIDGPVTWLSYAFRFMQLPLGLFGVAIAAATLPAISRNAAKGEIDELRYTLSRSLSLAFLLTIPSAVGLAVLGKSMIGAVYQWGRFQPVDTRQTAYALAAYAIGLAAYSAVKILVPAFYALGDSKTPMYVSLASILINILAASTLVRVAGLGHIGLALSTSFVATFGGAVLVSVLRRRIAGIHGRELLSSTGRIAAASALMGAACWASSTAIHAWLGASKVQQFTDLAISIPVGLAVFYAASRALGITELDSAIGAIAGPLRRRLGRSA
jgi:putative peptidoglycan lipid II flippase